MELYIGLLLEEESKIWSPYRGALGLVNQQGTDAPVQGETLLCGKGQCLLSA